MRQAKREGKYDEAVAELRGRSVELVDETVVCPPAADGGALTAFNGGATAALTNLRARDAEQAEKDADAAWQANAAKRAAWRIGGRPQHRPAHQSFYQSYSVNPITKRKRLLMAIDVRGYGAEIGKMRVFRPETGVWQVPRQDVLDKYSKVDAAKVKKQWLLDYDEAAKFCSHGPNCKHGNTCEVGKRVTHTTILTWRARRRG